MIYCMSTSVLGTKVVIKLGIIFIEHMFLWAEAVSQKNRFNSASDSDTLLDFQRKQ